ncbi:MAG: hypothetical protein WAM82_22030 [Thermoanaerobaculia bacterium]
MHKTLILALLSSLVLGGGRSASSQPAKQHAAPARLATVTLERAPGELGKIQSTGFLFIVTAAKGKEVLLFDSSSGELKPFLETGDSWAKPITLRGPGGVKFSPAAFRMAVNGGLIACAGPSGVKLFNLETGELAADAPYLNHAAAVAAMPDGSWAVSLTRLPFPEIERADEEKFGGPAPRFVIVNDKLDIRRQGLPAEKGRTPNQAAARALRLAASPDRVFAAEIGNYKLYEFNRGLKLRGTLDDPHLKLEEGIGLPADNQAQEKFLAEARQISARRGTDAAKGARPSEPTRGQSSFFSYQTVIGDMAWDTYSHQLILLLAEGIAADHEALDLLDPATGNVRRLFLRLPEGTDRKQLSQLAVGHRYLWFRSHSGVGPTFRLDRSALEQARSVTGVQRSAISAE